MNKKMGVCLKTVAAVGLLSFGLAEFAMADLANVAKTATKSAGAMKTLAIQVFYFMGVVAFGMGIWHLWKETKQPNQDHGKKGMVGMIAGVMLLSMGFWMGTLLETAGGTSSNIDSKGEDSSGSANY